MIRRAIRSLLGFRDLGVTDRRIVPRARRRGPALEILESRLLLFGCDDPGPSQLPDAVDDAAATVQDTPAMIAVLSNDTHPDGLPFSISAVGSPASGTASHDASTGQVTYTPNAGFTGTDSFSYTIEDCRSGTDSANITVTVGSTPDSGGPPTETLPGGGGDDTLGGGDDTLGGGNKPTVGVTASDSSAAEGDPVDKGKLKFTRSGGDMSQPLTVKFSVEEGDQFDSDTVIAASGYDYGSLGDSVTIPANDAFIEIDVTPIDDTREEHTEEVRVTLVHDESYEMEPFPAIVYIVDDDNVRIEISGNGDGAERASAPFQPGEFLVTRRGNLRNAVTVHYHVVTDVSPSATNGADYILSGTVAMGPWEDEVHLLVPVIDDNTPEPTEIVKVTLDLSPDHTYIMASPSTAQINIFDNERPVVSVYGGGHAFEAPAGPLGESRNGILSVTREGDVTDALTVYFTVGPRPGATIPQATPGVDYEALGNTVVIPAGAASANIVVKPIDDNDVEGTEAVTVTLDPETDYDVGVSDLASCYILDDDD
jgi:hypothetical protein